ncbi:MAG: hypothetical protein ACPGSN_06835 [Psychrobium sp.]
MMYKLVASLLAVITTALFIAIMAALVDDSKLTAQQVGQYRAENFIAVDDVIEVPQTIRKNTIMCFRLGSYEDYRLFIASTPLPSLLLADQVKLVDLSILNRQIKKSLTI